MNKYLPLIVFRISLSFATVLVISCAPAYVPNVVNTPMLSNQGELHLAINTGTSGIDPQISVSLADHFGMMLNGSFADRSSDYDDDFHKHLFLEMAPGYYTSSGQHGRFDLYGGFGFGRINAYNDGIVFEGNEQSKVTFYRYFIQPSIGYISKIFDANLGIRIAYVTIRQERKQESDFFYEPACTIKLGGKYFKLSIQTGISIPLGIDRLAFNYQPFMFSIGLQTAFGQK